MEKPPPPLPFLDWGQLLVRLIQLYLLVRVWNMGDYEKAWTSAMGTRAPRAPARKPSIDTILARAVKYGRMGMISKCCQALEAAPAAPATLETLRELQKLHPSLFVPLDCLVGQWWS
jgi:hypothetical protein